MSIHAKPTGFHTVTPYLVVSDAEAVLTFAQKAFNATVRESMRTPEGRLIHAEFQIGDSIVMLGEYKPGGKAWPAMLYLYVDDTDATWKAAVAAGGKSVMEPQDQFYGDRNAAVEDSTGNQWWMATHKEDLSPEELQRRAQAAGK